MSQIPKHWKLKRTQKRVLVKKRHFLTNFPETKSYKPLCKKLQNNNHSLAKALSKEKQESQLLFSQNVALIAEVQDLGLACSKRDAVISNVLKNAKEMLKMLVTMTGYLTNTISCCQESADSTTTNMRLSCNSAGRRESLRRLSIKSPTRGVVKPMVSGHTITKPTINLSRVNMQHINNSSNLSIIPEVATPPRNQEINSPRSPSAVSVRQNRFVNGRTCRMPERLTVASPRDSDESERRLSGENSRYSGRISGRLSKSRSRLSRSNNSRYSVENFEHLGSPRVTLNDVSKLLQNSQSINIRMLAENRNNREAAGNSNAENSDEANQENPQTGMIPETTSEESNEENNRSVQDGSEQNNSDMEITIAQKKSVIGTQNRTSDMEDPLEGPSWLFNNSQVVPSFTNKDKKTDDVDVSNDSNMSRTLQAVETSNVSDSDRTLRQTPPLPTSSKRSNHVNETHSDNNRRMDEENEYGTLGQNESNDTFCNTSVASNADKSECRMENEPTVNMGNFVTQRRGYFESEDEEDDFTLMLARKPRNIHFDINDLKLPVLEQSALKPVVAAEPEPEITNNLRKISQICPMPSVSHNTLDESAFNQSTVNLPQLMINDFDVKEFTPSEKKSKRSQRKGKVKKMTVGQPNDLVADMPPFRKKSDQKKKKEKVMKDPSAVKVVLEKLNESEVKSRTPSPNETASRDSMQSLSPVSLRADASSDSESNTSTNSLYTLNRPRRKRAPISLHEPNLRKKLRRNH